MTTGETKNMIFAISITKFIICYLSIKPQIIIKTFKTYKITKHGLVENDARILCTNKEIERKEKKRNRI